MACVSKALLQPYGGQCKRIQIARRLEKDGGSDATVRRFLERQEALAELTVYDPSLFPAADASLGWGGGRRLRRLFLKGDTRDTIVDGAAAADLSSLFSCLLPDALPALEELRIEWAWPDWNGFADFAALPGEGASSRLHMLSLNPGGCGATDVFDTLAAALEARRARSCAELRGAAGAGAFSRLR